MRTAPPPPRGLREARRGAEFFNFNDFEAESLDFEPSIEDSSRASNFIFYHFLSWKMKIINFL